MKCIDGINATAQELSNESCALVAALGDKDYRRAAEAARELHITCAYLMLELLELEFALDVLIEAGA